MCIRNEKKIFLNMINFPKKLKVNCPAWIWKHCLKEISHKSRS